MTDTPNVIRKQALTLALVCGILCFFSAGMCGFSLGRENYISALVDVVLWCFLLWLVYLNLRTAARLSQ